MIPDVPRELLVEAMTNFDQSLRSTVQWQDWEQNSTFKYALDYEGRLYPVKQIVSMATGVPVNSFSGGDQANSYVRSRGFDVTALRLESDILVKLDEWLKHNPRTMPDELRALREEFVVRFPKHKLKELTLEEYALGREGFQQSFSYWLEFKTNPLGSIKGGNASKHGVYWSDKDNAWRWNKKYASAEDAVSKITIGIDALVNAVENKQFDNLDQIGDELLGEESYSLRCKPLNLYFPELFLPVSNPDHIVHFLAVFGAEPKGDVLTNNRQLLALLTAQPEFAGFDTHQMTKFLYDAFPQRNPQTWYIYVSYGADKNFELASDRGVWGAKKASLLSGIKAGDTVVFVVGLTTSPEKDVPPGFPRVSTEVYRQTVGTAERIVAAEATSNLYHDKEVIWPDGDYPHRFRFRVVDERAKADLNVNLDPAAIEAVRLSTLAQGKAYLAKDPETNVWLFQAQPEVYDLKTIVRTKQVGDSDSWSVTSSEVEMRQGDTVILWQAGKDAGIYALGELVGQPYDHVYETDVPAWLKPVDGQPENVEKRVGFKYTKILSEPVPRLRLLNHPVLKNMHVIKFPTGINFRVSLEEWAALRNLIETDSPATKPDYIEPSFEEVAESIRQRGLRIDDSSLRRYHLSLKSRGFVILSGLSGTGKTWLGEVYAQVVGASYQIVPVAPNWMTNEDLLGYLNPLDDKYHHTAFSQFLIRCGEEYEQAQLDRRTPRPYHLILDEMNLARVEQYFAKFLSAMEVRHRNGIADIELSPGEKVKLTPNLYFVGTVNVDETTHSFADKVYDRAQLIELRTSREQIEEHLTDRPFKAELLAIWEATNRAAPFAYRVLDDIAKYVHEANKLGVTWQAALDEQVLQKILPKVKGVDSHVRDALSWIVSSLPPDHYPLTVKKAREMLDGYNESGFASYF